MYYFFNHHFIKSGQITFYEMNQLHKDKYITYLITL